MPDEDGLQYLAPLLKGAVWTIVLCVISGAAGTLIGSILGLARTSGSRTARRVSAAYINFIRGIPLLIILFFVYFALPLLIPGAVFDQLTTAFIAMSIYVGAYIGEVVRGSIESVPKGQLEAAEALGMSYFQKFRYVIVPQAMKVIVPPYVGVLISLTKDSSLVSIIGFVELTKAGRIVSILTMDPIPVFIGVGALYFLICYPISLFGRHYERRLAAADAKDTDMKPRLVAARRMGE
ncbi:MAG: amino acid ABC transporter permease [Acidimicrobiia bacterium]